MRTTIRQVAERANVSPMTVSRVLQGRKEQVNQETYQRILGVMQELNYVPVRPVLQNRHIETNIISLVPMYRTPSRSLVDSLTFEGLCDQASAHGYDLFIMLRGEAEWMANREEVRFLDRRSDGFIFISSGQGEWKMALDALVQHEIATVVCYRRDVPEGIVWVDVDNENIINLSFDCLLKHGHDHSRILYLSGPKSDSSDSDLLANLSGLRSNFDDQQRRHQFMSRLSELGESEPENQVIPVKNWRLDREQVQTLLDSGATGVICGDDFALQLWDILENMGKKVPDDLSIISIDNQINAAHRGLTSVGFGFDAVGRAAVKAWVERQKGNEIEKCHKIVPVQLVERVSVGAPRPTGQ